MCVTPPISTSTNLYLLARLILVFLSLRLWCVKLHILLVPNQCVMTMAVLTVGGQRDRVTLF